MSAFLKKLKLTGQNLLRSNILIEIRFRVSAPNQIGEERSQELVKENAQIIFTKYLQKMTKIYIIDQGDCEVIKDNRIKRQESYKLRDSGKLNQKMYQIGIQMQDKKNFTSGVSKLKSNILK
ncbi:unnamed protein product (macronuclear) [Paramecium tetraurelia]|uniref:Uncharacterized protein n=1 Tax=Paramecium tetraurelia TaxID=5888 RepID=A0C7M2_PARTE|nr:uncharacterized protein GSPATT00035919001 [Paramecium tetraurelia]CAK66789.1 unnamed protein product [Paramecium tetraurelia]|eukprot:XP_001434186.1 hypothetical protein (macronuclear) [Paramecium tetraurelia strain d4-2]